MISYLSHIFFHDFDFEIETIKINMIRSQNHKV